ncbi:hypothetical protein [Corynebacterium pelargi]|uniref:ABC-2 family transporter protein n=1 Tax=Corynebacterium pelargi TaxID=1471400 RepID=A0A410WB30_9CORY|nr:hypothetical protein [Corynebacterium pelargi]QAU53178.1 ABC-2 family transporter protein [Corynebacterium pelargi]GGG74303.1 hypothetical protein GCM10007338_09580 [Corynebacterium pelargi]
MHVLKSELTKLLTLRSTWITFGIAIVLMQIPVLVQGFVGTESQDVSISGALVADMLYALIMTYFGAAIGRDLNFKLHAQAMLTQPSRGSWIFARIFWLNLFAFLGLVVVVALSAVIATIMPDLHFQAEGWESFGTAALKTLTMLNLGTGFAMLTRSTAAGVSIPLALALVVDNLLYVASMKFEFVKYLLLISPTTRAGQFGVDNGEPRGFEVGQYQPDWFNGTVMLVWLVLMIALALWSNKRDVR